MSFKDKLISTITKYTPSANNMYALIQIAQTLGPNPTIYSAIGAGASALGVGSSMFLEKALKGCFVRLVNHTVSSALGEKLISEGSCKQVSSNTIIEGAECSIYSTELYGETLYFSKNKDSYHHKCGFCIFNRDITAEQLELMLKRKIWELFPRGILLQTSQQSEQGMKMEEHFPENRIIYESELAEKIISLAKKSRENKINRSVLLWGPPGTGKSSIVACVTNNLSKRLMFVGASGLSSYGSDYIVRSIVDLSPDCVVLDDFNIYSASSSLMYVLERINKSVPLVLMTANGIKDLPKAVLRPGRVDEIVYVGKLEPAVAKRVAGNLNNGDRLTDEQLDLVADWPVAFITELCARIALGRNFQQEYEELKVRVEKNTSSDEEKNHEAA